VKKDEHVSQKAVRSSRNVLAKLSSAFTCSQIRHVGSMFDGEDRQTYDNHQEREL